MELRLQKSNFTAEQAWGRRTLPFWRPIYISTPCTLCKRQPSFSSPFVVILFFDSPCIGKSKTSSAACTGHTSERAKQNNEKVESSGLWIKSVSSPTGGKPWQEGHRGTAEMWQGQVWLSLLGHLGIPTFLWCFMLLLYLFYYLLHWLLVLVWFIYLLYYDCHAFLSKHASLVRYRSPGWEGGMLVVFSRLIFPPAFD